MKKIYKFMIGGVILLILLKLPYLKEQTFDLAALFGLIVMGSIFGYIVFLFFGKDKKK